MNRQGLEAMASLVAAYGWSDTRRGLVHLASVVIALDDGVELPTRPGVALAKYWNENPRTTQREAQAWNRISNGADVVEVARAVLDEHEVGKLAKESRTRASILMAPYVPW